MQSVPWETQLSLALFLQHSYNYCVNLVLSVCGKLVICLTNLHAVFAKFFNVFETWHSNKNRTNVSVWNIYCRTKFWDVFLHEYLFDYSVSNSRVFRCDGCV